MARLRWSTAVPSGCELSVLVVEKNIVGDTDAMGKLPSVAAEIVRHYRLSRLSSSGASRQIAFSVHRRTLQRIHVPFN